MNKSMQISHAEAMQLIQFRADNQKILSEHLKDCFDCRTYAQQLNKTENVLRTVMRKQWNINPAPLSIAVLMGNTGKKSSSAILITRTALISVAFLAFIIIGWQFTATNPKSMYATQFDLLPIPTPSTQITATTFLSNNCIQSHYQVQKNDTLESIAAHFTTSKEALMELNSMKSDVIEPDTELLVPICDTTPTSTLYAPTFTITPILNPTTTTPG